MVIVCRLVSVFMKFNLTLEARAHSAFAQRNHKSNNTKSSITQFFVCFSRIVLTVRRTVFAYTHKTQKNQKMSRFDIGVIFHFHRRIRLEERTKKCYLSAANVNFYAEL